MVDELIYLLRIVFAVVLGFAIGFERKLRFKEADAGKTRGENSARTKLLFIQNFVCAGFS